MRCIIASTALQDTVNFRLRQILTGIADVNKMNQTFITYLHEQTSATHLKIRYRPNLNGL